MHITCALVFSTLLSYAASKAAKREYGTYDYYVLEHDKTEGTSLDSVVDVLGVEVVERAGELRDHWLVRAPKTVDVRQTLHSIQGQHDSHRHAKRAVSAVAYLEKQVLRQRVKRAGTGASPLDQVSSVMEERASIDIANALKIRDPEFANQWHLYNDETPLNSMNVTGLWELGIAGEGVHSAMVDDGVDYTSDDLAANFVS
jgi:kexin